MYLQQINQINGIIFTAREIDIISCILNVRGSKKIADILSISPRTVEGHIKNILTKIASNSQESIKDFVERSPQLILVKRHYIDLLINRLFLSQIAKVAVILKNRDISCSVHYVINEKLEYIIGCLKLANINVSHKAHQNHISSNQKTIEILTEEHLLQLKQGVKFDNIILICFDKEVSDDF
jgi:DNA-binding CsgD family transcriptional regulator